MTVVAGAGGRAVTVAADDLALAGVRWLGAAGGAPEACRLVLSGGRALPGDGRAVPVEARWPDLDVLAVPQIVDPHGHFGPELFPLGVDASAHARRARVGLVIDGGSYGAAQLRAFRRLVVEPCPVPVYCFAHLCCTGLLTGAVGVPEFSSADLADVDGTVRACREEADVVVGIKLRLTAGIRADPRELLDLACRARDAAGTRLMVHVAESPLPLAEVVDRLDAGDVVTHVFHGGREWGTPGTVTREGVAALLAARERGVLMDVGHGGVHVSFDVARRLVAEGLEVDMLGTDAHAGPPDRVVPDVVGVMNTMLAAGAPLPSVLRASFLARGWESLPRRDGAGDGAVTLLALEEGTDVYAAGDRLTRSGGRRLRHLGLAAGGQLRLDDASGLRLASSGTAAQVT